jgi:hypothetical protein
MKNLTYSQLIELAPKDRPFQIAVESNPYGYGLHQTLWAYIDEGELSTETTTKTIDGVAYFWHLDWKYSYKGTFTLIDPRYQKPEVLKVGQKVRIMESAKDIGEWIVDGAENLRNMASLETQIDEVWDNETGVKYRIGQYILPHYCVMPVEEEEEIEKKYSLKAIANLGGKGTRTYNVNFIDLENQTIDLDNCGVATTTSLRHVELIKNDDANMEIKHDLNSWLNRK